MLAAGNMMSVVLQRRGRCRSRSRWCGFVALLVWGLLAPMLRAEISDLPAELRAAEIRENLGTELKKSAWVFKDEQGVDTPLVSLMNDKPSILVMAYYNCPSLCGALLNGVNNSLRAIQWTAGQEFNLIVVSISPKETSALAAAKKANFVKAYGRLEAATGIHFLVGSEDQIQGLAQQIGFNFYFDNEIKEYAHSAGIFFISPSGMLSRVLFGIDFPARDLKMALMEASEGRIGNVVERFMMFCYKYDPSRRGYAPAAMRLVQLGGLLMLLATGIYIAISLRRERRRHDERRKAA